MAQRKKGREEIKYSILKNTLSIGLIGGGLVFYACNSKNTEVEENKQKQEQLNFEELPEGKWNGEYIKVEGEEKEDRILKKSLGSEFLNLGEIDIFIGDEQLKIVHFEGKKNALSFNNDMINALIKSEKEEYIHLKLEKTGILKNYQGIYAIKSGKLGAHLTITIGNEEFKLTQGDIELINFSPSIGNLELRLSGKSGATNIEGSIKMRFDNHVFVGEI